MIDQCIFNNKIDFHGSKGLVFIGEKILVYRRDTKTDRFPLYIDLPGGRRENYESPFESFKREVKEEFGIDINEGHVTYAKQYPSVIDSTKKGCFIVTRLPEINKEKIVFGNEGLEYFLVTIPEYMKLPDTIENHRIKITDYLESLK